MTPDSADEFYRFLSALYGIPIPDVGPAPPSSATGSSPTPRQNPGSA
jgi:hypothetical protein